MSAEDRRALRAFVRAHHPDVGGDPAEFVAGLARLRAATAPIERTDRPADWPPDGDPRLDAPVVLLADPVPVRVARALARRLRRMLHDPKNTPIRID